MHDTLRMQAVRVATGSILVVEDDEPVARSLSRMIESLGYKVTHALRSEDAVELVTARSFDVVLCDLHLEGASGMDVLAVARAYLPDAALVLMTASPSMETAIAAVSLGLFEYLLKPFERDQVKRMLERATRRRLSGSMAAAVEVTEKEIDHALRERYELALGSLSVELEPICDATTRDLFAFSARMSSSEETLETETSLLHAAAELGRLPDLRRRVRDLAAKGFASAPAHALLFVDIEARDLDDEDLFSTDPPLARIADRVVLQLRSGLGDRSLEDVVARTSVLRFIGYRISLADLDGNGASIAALAEIAPDYARIDSRMVRGVATSPCNRRVVAGIASACAALGIVSIADGVACSEDRLVVVEAACRLVQGSLVARHSPASSRHPSIVAASARPRASLVRQA